MLRDEGVGLGPQRGRQHPARPVPGDLGQRVINRFRLTQGDDIVSSVMAYRSFWKFWQA